MWLPLVGNRDVPEVTNMIEYKHTQPGILLRFVLGSCAIFSVGMTVLMWDVAVVGTIATSSVSLVLVICFVLFHSLTVKVTQDVISLKFGSGPIGKQFAVSDVESAKVVTNRWYYGWGIKMIPHGWLFNVSGFDAVEIQLQNGRKYRIGTDEPDELCSAIEAVIQSE